MSLTVTYETAPECCNCACQINQILLIRRDADDKSRFLAQAGYGQENWQQVEADLRNQILPLDAIASDEPNSYPHKEVD